MDKSLIIRLFILVINSGFLFTIQRYIIVFELFIKYFSSGKIREYTRIYEIIRIDLENTFKLTWSSKINSIDLWITKKIRLYEISGFNFGKD